MKLKFIILNLGLVSFFFACKNDSKNSRLTSSAEQDKIRIASMLDSFNRAAAEANYEKYFSYYTKDAIFIGTDATENWNKDEFMVWAKPFFDKKRTWNFTAIQRHIFIGEDNNVAWFNELLSTQMKICRGSGVLIKQNQAWKVQQYVLSTTIPNSLIDSVVALKSPEEDALMIELQK
jgi:ketosteroid isomerase-like protein